MKTLLAIVLLFNIVIFNVSAQTTKPNYIIKLELALITAGNNYQVDFTDSIKFKHPYIKSGKSLDC